MNKFFRLGRLREPACGIWTELISMRRMLCFCIRFYRIREQSDVVDQSMYFYYQHEASVSHNYKEAFAARCERLITVTVQYYRSLGLYDAVKEGIYVKSFAFFA